MTASTDTIASWVATQGENAATTLGARYLGEDVAMLNAEQIVDVVNGLWREFRESQGDAGEAAGWSYVSGGMAKAILVRDGIELGVERFCGGWTLGDEKTVKLLAQMQDAASSDERS